MAKSTKVNTLEKPSQKKGAKATTATAESNEVFPSKAEQREAKQRAERADKRRDKQTELVALVKESTVLIERGMYVNDALPRIKALTDDKLALEEIQAETKKINEARRNYERDAKRIEKRNELQAEFDGLKEFSDAETAKQIADTADNKVAIELLQGAIKTAKNLKVSQANERAENEIANLFNDEQVGDVNALQIIGNDDLSVEKYEVSLKSKIASLADNLQAVDADGKPLIAGKSLLSILNMSETDKRVRWIQEGLVGMEIKRRVALKRQSEGLQGDGFIETLKRMSENGELQSHYVTLQKNTNVVERFYKYLVGVDVETILPREHYVTLLSWAKDREATELDKFFADAPVMNDGKAISLNDVKAMATTAKADVSLDSKTGENVIKDEKIIIKLSASSYADIIPQMIEEYGSAQAFFETMLQEKYIAIDANDSDLTQAEIDEALADFDDAIEVESTVIETETETITELETVTDDADGFDDFD